MEPGARDDAFLRGVLGAVASAIDPAALPALRAALAREVLVDEASPASKTSAASAGSAGRATDESSATRPAMPSLSDDVLRRIVLADVLDDSILSARPGDKAFALRLFFGDLGAALTDESVADAAFALASGLNFYFRVPMDEEVKMRTGIEVSRLYYRYAASRLEPSARAQTSPSLAALMNAELPRLRFESVDQMTVFDSALHERAPEASPHGATLTGPVTFLCRALKTNVVRARAVVLT